MNNIKMLSDSEKEIMEIIWRNGRVCVRDVLRELKKKKKIAYTTVMTVMSRLFVKGILKRKINQSGAFIYEPVSAKKAFIEEKAGRMIKNFLNEYGDIAIAQFFETIESSSISQSTEWKNKLKKIIK